MLVKALGRDASQRLSGGWGLFRVSYFWRKRKGIKILSYLLEKLVEHIPKKRASYCAQLINVWKLSLANSKGFCPCDGSA